jgi:hypothetical protein
MIRGSEVKMRKTVSIVLVFCLFMLFSCSGETGVTSQQDDGSSGTKFQELSIPNALAKAETENKIVLIDFFSPT